MATLTVTEHNLIPENDQANVLVDRVENNDFEYKGEMVHKLRWYFTVLDEGPFKGKQIQGDTTTNFVAHPSCKAYNWAVAIIGHQIEPGTDFDFDDLSGQRARVLVGRRVSGQGNEFEKVTEVMPPRSAATSGPAAAPQVERAYDPAVDGAPL